MINLDKYYVLKKYFGYTEFRQGQEEIIDSILNGNDALGVMPTGAGKSICFQVPALLFSGITIVVSPLISLMNDQVTALINDGIRAAYINGSLTERQIIQVINRAGDGYYKIIYVAPERLEMPAFREMVKRLEISMICVDEAHCISQWGQDFRPSYLRIGDFIDSLEKRPVITAFTATATIKVRDDIEKLLSLNKPKIVVTSFDRNNLYFEVIKPKIKFIALKRYLDLYEGKSGIIYCSSRKTTDELFERLAHDGYSVTRYHAGLPKQERTRNQNLFISDEAKIIIATNAFGMGINKPNVSFVIHYNMPGDIESYYQEAGRAGRDGNPADCILFFSESDIRTQKYFINNPEENEELSDIEKDGIRRLRLIKLEKMIVYSTRAVCLRNYILGYFGEVVPGKCGNCSACNGNIGSVDITVEGKKIFSCIKRINESEKIDTVTDILKGENNDSFIGKDFEKLSTFGIMSDVSKKIIEDTIRYLVSIEYIHLTDEEKLYLDPKAKEVLFGGKKIRRVEKQKEKKISGEYAEKLHADSLLLEHLKELTRNLAKKNSVPYFIIFTDATLRAMAISKPKTEAQLAHIPGVSQAKIRKYGKFFIDEIALFESNNSQ